MLNATREENKMQTEKEKHRVKCPNCNRMNIYYRLSDNTFICRLCGTTWEKPKEKKATP